MKVTPKHRKFGKYEIGSVFELPDRQAKALILVGKVEEAEGEVTERPSPVYQTRAMTAQAPAAAIAPYGLKADGTPRKRPGRPSASE